MERSDQGSPTMKTTQTTQTTQGFVSTVGRWIATAGGALVLGLTLGLGSGAADTTDYQPGDAAGHANADLQAANERQAAAVDRAVDTRWAGDAAGFGASDLLAVDDRQAAGIARGSSSAASFG